MIYKHIFGPVPSRRLGMSLGIDPVVRKTCSFDCVYCECGKTTDLTLERKEYVPFKDLARELDHYWEHNEDPDYMTFSGSGEPTLNINIGKIIEYIRARKPGTGIAVLTNSTLLHDKSLRSELAGADLVAPSLDTVSGKAFVRLNRPASGIGPEDCIKGIKNFAKEYKGKIWLETVIIPGFNDNEPDLLLLKDTIEEIRPELIHLNTLDRPGTVPDIRPASKKELERVVKILNSDNIHIIGKTPDKKAGIKRDDIESSITGIIKRRPCTMKDLLKISDLDKDMAGKVLAKLEKEKKIEKKKQKRGIFYQALKS